MLNDYIIPGLRAVKQDIEALAPDCEVGHLAYHLSQSDQISFVTDFLSVAFSQETVQLLLKECEVKADQKSFAQ